MNRIMLLAFDAASGRRHLVGGDVRRDVAMPHPKTGRIPVIDARDGSLAEMIDAGGPGFSRGRHENMR